MQKRFGKGTRYDLKARVGCGGAESRSAAQRIDEAPAAVSGSGRHRHRQERAAEAPARRRLHAVLRAQARPLPRRLRARRSETLLWTSLAAAHSASLAPQRANLDGQGCVEVRVRARRRHHAGSVGRGGPVRRLAHCVLRLRSLTRGRSARKVATTGQLALGHRTRGEGDSRPEDGKHTLMPLDATVLDVYSGAHAVVFMVDPSKPWTVDYVTRELAKCPEHVRAHDSRILHARLLICSLAASGCCVGQLP